MGKVISESPAKKKINPGWYAALRRRENKIAWWIAEKLDDLYDVTNWQRDSGMNWFHIKSRDTGKWYRVTVTEVAENIAKELGGTDR
jgi:hypothetical protein